MCGEIGVSSKHRNAGDAIGPRTENEYAVLPVGVATITPSAAYVVNGVPLIDTSRRMKCPGCCFSSTASLSANSRCSPSSVARTTSSTMRSETE